MAPSEKLYPQYPDGPGIQAKEKIARLLNVMEREFSTYDLVRALEGILLDMCQEEARRNVSPDSWIRWFVPTVAENFTDLHEKIILEEQIADAMERNRKAGGTGTPYQ